jgi:organic hydroperoxide reductase OsmC/OhrA
VAFSGERLPTRDEIAALHSRSHAECFIANSVTTEVCVEPHPDA